MNEITIYDNAPIVNLTIPNEATPTASTGVMIQHKKTKFFCWQTDIEQVCKEGIEHDGPLTGELQQWVEQCITQHTGSTTLVHLRSWWSILNHGLAVPKHDHRYQTKRKTLSGVLWIQGDTCPLFVQAPEHEVQQIDNVPGRCVLFSSATSHWTEPYPYKNLRVGISFDYLVKDQPLCACENEKFCFRCVHLVKNLEQAGISTLLSGGSRSHTTKVYK